MPTELCVIHKGVNILALRLALSKLYALNYLGKRFGNKMLELQNFLHLVKFKTNQSSLLFFQGMG